MKTTPGPWQAVPQDMDTGHKWFDIWSATYGSVAHISEEARSDEGMQFFRGDAQLIGAAPDLLEALKAVVRIADRRTVEFDRARAAIAKAEGR